ncbi:MAG: PQQ-binding-like beta-propeller repeat protein [Planctomycetaceae bacterium]|nr:PQQ-binding-like beta-propeller repeat protein [Planctomycetaceae bacterium]
MAVACASLAAAQSTVQPHPPLGLDVSLPAAKRMAGANEFIRAGEWDAAIKSLEQLKQDFGGELIAVAPNRYLNVREAVSATFASLPTPGLAVYRRRIDPSLLLQFEDAAARRDRAMMQQVLRDGFAGSSGDDALDWLAEDALERGDLDAARIWWTALLPPPPAAERNASLILRYPDAARTPAEIYARLVLCSLLQGDRARTARELRFFTSRFGDVHGDLAGRSGLLSELLAQLLRESSQWESPGSRRQPGPAVSRVLWSQPLNVGNPSDSEREAADNSQIATEAPGVVPAVWEGTVLVSSSAGVRALSVETGKARWPAGPDDDGTLDAVTTPWPSPSLPTIGTSRRSGQVAGGCYYTRIGPLVSVPSIRGPETGPSELKCFDLLAEGRPSWSVASDELPELSSARFSGPPLVNDGRLYIAVRRAQPQVESGLACFAASTGQLLWSRRLCAALASPPVARHRIDDDVLASGAGLVFQIPGPGVITACDAVTGELRWAVTYAPIATAAPHAESVALLYDGGRLFVAAANLNQLLALDACDGRQLWAAPRSGRIRNLLGVAEGRLIAAGDQLWGFDVERGTAWRFGYDDPEGHGYGAGALHAGRVYWPTREELFVVDAGTGGLRERLSLAGPAGLGGGNLVIAGDCLLVASETHLTAVGPLKR